MNRVQQQSAFVLHRRPYRNTSLLVDLFTKDHGRISLIARSARGPRSRFRGMIEPFIPLEVNWSGKSELKYLQQLEYCGVYNSLTGQHLMIGLHINELLYRFLGSGVVFSELYDDYAKLLQYMTKRDESRCLLVLCYFELRLLNYVGYGITLDKTAAGENISADAYYLFSAEHGFSLVADRRSQQPQIFKGSVMLALSNKRLQNTDVADVRRLLQIAMRSHLGNKSCNALSLILL
jgi:DNA repair protein RecO (recombination protein O)